MSATDLSAVAFVTVLAGPLLAWAVVARYYEGRQANRQGRR